MKAVKRAATALMLASAAGCAIAPATPGRREAIARQIADDAIAFNEAYARAVSGQILLNVLRARDRQPRYYLSMSGIQDAPSIRFRQTGSAGSIPLGEGASPWGFGSFTFERESQSRPSYALQPFGPEALTRVAFQPTGANVFAHYWNSGWPRDLLMLLLVEEITVARPGEPARTLVNDAAGIRGDCPPTETSAGCAFVQTVREMLDDIAGLADRSASGPCGLIGVYGAAPEAAAPANCPARIVVADKTYGLALRSLDDMVYYVGELLRATQGREGRVLEAGVGVRAAGLSRDAAGETIHTPLFRVVDLGEGWLSEPGGFAASTVYQGRRYAAGPPVARNCRQAEEQGVCRPDPELGDRSSSVLSLMAELFALNQSPDALRPPTRLIAE